jgi:hypothetical protein
MPTESLWLCLVTDPCDLFQIKSVVFHNRIGKQLVTHAIDLFTGSGFIFGNQRQFNRLEPGNDEPQERSKR